MRHCHIEVQRHTHTEAGASLVRSITPCPTSEGWLVQVRPYPRTGICVNSFGVTLCDVRGMAFVGTLRTPPRQRRGPPGPFVGVTALPPPPLWGLGGDVFRDLIGGYSFSFFHG